jgi:hypothetical protein
MSPFFKSLLMGTWVLVLLTGIGNAHRPVFPPASNQDFVPSPLPLSFLWQPSTHHPCLSTIDTPPEHVSIVSLLSNGADYHQRLVVVRGLITQPELHLDVSELFINFVFRLADEDQSVVVFGRHDRTQGAPSISLDLPVEVIGVFWKERDLNNSHITNTIEALSVVPYPSLTPENA